MTRILISTQKQTLELYKDDRLLHAFSISSALNGVGQEEGSGCTPLGSHQIAEKVGDDLPKNAVFVARQFTGELYDDKLAQAYPERDWILGRILWLEGCEDGINQGVNSLGRSVDSKSRYIYIHGTPDSEPMGIPRSHGCIRMRNDDLVKLYPLVAVGTPVQIV